MHTDERPLGCETNQNAYGQTDVFAGVSSCQCFYQCGSVFICGFDGFAQKTAAGAPAQGVVAGMARGRRVDDGATGGMSADILLAHCIAAAKVRRQSPQIRSAVPKAKLGAPFDTARWAAGGLDLAAAPECDCRRPVRALPLPAVTCVTVRDIRRAANRPHINLSLKPGKGTLVKRTELGRGV